MTRKDPGSAGTERCGIPRTVFRTTPTPTPIYSGARRTWDDWKARGSHVGGLGADSDCLPSPSASGRRTPTPKKVPNQVRWEPQVPRRRLSASLRLAEHAGRESSQPYHANRRSAGLDYNSQDALRLATEGGPWLPLATAGLPARAGGRQGARPARDASGGDAAGGVAAAGGDPQGRRSRSERPPAPAPNP